MEEKKSVLGHASRESLNLLCKGLAAVLLDLRTAYPHRDKYKDRDYVALVLLGGIVYSLLGDMDKGKKVNP